MDNNSAESAKFNFNVKAKDEQKEVASVSSSIKEVETDNVAVDDMDEPFTDHGKITISLVRNYSLFRQANDKVLPKRKDYIGSSIESSRILASNKEEVEAYFPNIIGLSTNDPKFIFRVKQYLNNIRIGVDELGKSFDISFHYFKKSDYYKIKREIESIEQAYQNANKTSISRLRAALKEKITRLNVIEGTKHKYGYPINVEDYLMYRHCLLYNDIAKDLALVNADRNIRFYFKDERKEADKALKLRKEKNKAIANYVSCLADPELFEAVYIQYCSIVGRPVLHSLAEAEIVRQDQLEKFSNEHPDKFNKLIANKDVKLMSMIELLIARGEIVRPNYSQNITTLEGDLIGSNMSEAVAWFKDVKNTSVVNAYRNKLKNI